MSGLAIADGLVNKLTLTAIAAGIGKNKSTVCREVRAHSIEGVYLPHRAHRDAAAARARPKTSKLVTDPVLREQVELGLERKLSPEQICNRLVKDFPDDESMRVSHETIYQALYVQARGGLRREVQTGAAHRADPPQAPPPARPAPAPVRRRDGDDLRAARRGRRPRRARPLGRRPDHRHGQPVRDRHPGRTRHPLRRCWSTCPAATTPSRSATPDRRPIADPARAPARVPDLGPGHEMAAHQQFTIATGHRRLLLRPALTLATRHRTRTPTACCASTSPRAPTCPSTAPKTSNTSPKNSTADHAKRSAGKPQPACVIYSGHLETKAVLRRPLNHTAPVLSWRGGGGGPGTGGGPGGGRTRPGGRRPRCCLG